MDILYYSFLHYSMSIILIESYLSSFYSILSSLLTIHLLAASNLISILHVILSTHLSISISNSATIIISLMINSLISISYPTTI
jgi:hypothetical protein